MALVENIRVKSDGVLHNNGVLNVFLDKVGYMLDAYLPVLDGSQDVAPQINALIQAVNAAGGGYIFGSSTSKYLVRSTISFVGTKHIHMEGNYGIVRDDVQGFIPDSGNRANHTFLVYNATDIIVEGFTYEQVSTRANRVPLGGPNTCMIWVGGQYLGGAMTRDVKIRRFTNLENNACDDGFFLCGMGELDNILVEDVYLKGGNWNWGVNFEYGLAPEDPAVNPNSTL